jgi:hypothetical protein
MRGLYEQTFLRRCHWFTSLIAFLIQVQHLMKVGVISSSFMISQRKTI